MERIAAQSLPWRLFAVFTASLLALVGFVSPALPAPALSLAGAKAAYWLLAPVGLLGFAYGFRLFGRTFWRFYAVIFSVEIMLRFVRLALGRSSHSPLLVVFALAVTALVCIALLRHAELLGPRDRPDLAGVFR